ncbi:MAG: PHP domain-containing protein [Dehalococcoidia bacterium]|nr:PHP domain-containing protein [Dehalococcoidia bacterium]
MLRADLHMHTYFSRDCATPMERLVDRCVLSGVNCIAVTDHNTIQGAMTMKEMAPLTVIVGEEIKTADGDIIGLFLNEEVPPGLTAFATARRIRAQGALVSIPHPFDWFRSSVIRPDALEDILPLADIVEGFNARNILPQSDRKAMALAEKHGLAVSAVSDAHTEREVGRTYVEMPEFDGTAQGFLSALRQGTLVTHRSSPLVHLATRYQTLKGRLLGR